MGEVKVVPAAMGARVRRGELVLKDEGAAAEDVVGGEEALEGDGGVVGRVEAAKEEVDGGGWGLDVQEPLHNSRWEA